MALIDSVTFRGSGLTRDLRQALVSASFNSSVSQISQVDMQFTDKDWKILGSNLITMGMSVDIGGLQMEVSVLETGDTNGVESFSVKCRPRFVRALKRRVGTRVMKNVSPSQFVAEECKAVGIKYRVQSSARRNQVARDLPKEGTQEVENPPSSWTTFTRLARELGYLAFDSGNQFFFGKPTYFHSEGFYANTYANYVRGKSGPGHVYTVPQLTRSFDSPGESLSTTMHTDSVMGILPGMRLFLKGVPTFDGEYLITSVDLDLLAARPLVNVEAGTALNDAPSGDGADKHKGTLSSADFVYWVLKQIGNTYRAGVQTELGADDPSVFDGSELVQWGAAQVGAFMPDMPNDQMAYMRNRGTAIGVQAAVRTRGAILWRDNYVGISLGDGRVVEEVHGRVNITGRNAVNRFSDGGRIPGIQY